MGRPSRSCCYQLSVITAILTGGLNIGMSMGILGPTLPDLALQTGVSLTVASTLASWRAFTYIIGSLVSGLLLEHVEGYFLLSVILLLQAVTTALSGWFSSFALIAIFQSLSNLFATFMFTGLHVLVFQLERSLAEKVVQGGFMLFNIGKAVIPFIAAPFLAPGINNTTTTSLPLVDSTVNTAAITVIPNNFTIATPEIFANATGTTVYNVLSTDMAAGLGPTETVTNVAWVYVTIGVCCLLMFFLYAGIAIVNGCHWRARKVAEDNQEKKEMAPSPPPPDSRTRMILSITFFIMAAFMQYGIEFVDNSLLLSFVYEYMHRSKMTGLVLTSLYQGIKVFVCIGSLFLVNRVHPSILVLVDIICMVTSTGGMMGAVIADSEPFFYVTIIILAIGMANYYASTISWLRRYYPVTGRIASLMAVSFGLSGMALPPLTTMLLNSIGPAAFPGVLFMSSVFCGVAWGALKGVLREPICPPSVTLEAQVNVDESTRLVKDNESST